MFIPAINFCVFVSRNVLSSILTYIMKTSVSIFSCECYGMCSCSKLLIGCTNDTFVLLVPKKMLAIMSFMFLIPIFKTVSEGSQSDIKLFFELQYQ